MRRGLNAVGGETVADYVAAGAVAVGVGPEIVRDGFDASEVEAAAQRMRAAMDRARD